MKTNLLRVALRYKAIYLPKSAVLPTEAAQVQATWLAANLAKLGFGLTEAAWQALQAQEPAYMEEVLAVFQEVMGVNKNWTPLVKGWDVPTGETIIDYLQVLLATWLEAEGTKLPCGHIVPEGSFDLSRYNGCPFCGTPFEFEALSLKEQGSKPRVLELWTETEAEQALHNLLTSQTALDATQIDSLKLLLAVLPLPAVKVGMKETLMLLPDIYLELGQTAAAVKLFAKPSDLLRYFWYKKTGFLQLIKPATVVRRKRRNAKMVFDKALSREDKAKLAGAAAAKELRLHYSRAQAKVYATWLNSIIERQGVAQAAEDAHPKRRFWQRFIRALRLPEYAKKPGYEALAQWLDKLYRGDYRVWAAEVQAAYLARDPKVLQLLSQRPGLFSRQLFALMLRLAGEADVLAAFAPVAERTPMRLLLTLLMYADLYFDPKQKRTVRPLGSTPKVIEANKALGRFTEAQRQAMVEGLEQLVMQELQARFRRQETTVTKVYIEKQLYNMPLPIGDRAETMQDLPSVLMGTRMPMEGDTLRLFMQWGEGLPAQHLDMDLSVGLVYPNRSDYCSFSRLSPEGCRHSGDIRQIPEMIGTAEYIDLDLKVLEEAGLLYAVFGCNAFSRGELSPNLVIGWMDSRHPMTVSSDSGVAYDPSCVQHQVRITQSLSKGLCFGVLELKTRHIIWLEMPFEGQTVHSMSLLGVETLLKRLDSKLSIGQLLKLRAEALGQTLCASREEAEEVYTAQWGLDAAGVTQLLVEGAAVLAETEV